MDEALLTSFEQSPESVLFNPYLPEVHADPYPLYHDLRTKDPMYHSPFGVWIVTRYDDAVSVLRDHRFSVDPKNRALPIGMPEDLSLEGPGPEEREFGNVMLFIDPPDHTRLRSLVNKAFTPRVVEGLRPRIAGIVDSLLDDVEERRAMDVIADLAYPLPVMVIGELLGIPGEDRARIKEWSRDIAPILDPVIAPEVVVGIRRAQEGLRSYFEDLISDRRARPGHDLLSELIRARDEDDRLSQDELRATCVLLLIAGHETTMNLIGNGLLALLRHRDQLDRLRDDSSLFKSAVEELLRYDGPVHLTGRTALEDIDVGGATVSKGELCVVLLGAADRDPDQFRDPDLLDVGRTPNRHIAFSAGPHFCLGATLARTEAQVAFEAMARRLPVLELAGDEPEWRETITLRGLKALHVTF